MRKNGTEKQAAWVILVVGLVGGCVLVLAPVAKATTRTLAAFAGNPLDGSSLASCFAESSGAVTGTGTTGCVGTPFSSSPRWEINLPIDTQGAKNVRASIRGDGTTGPNCTAYAADVTSGSFTSSSSVTNATTSLVQKLMTLTVPAGGYLFVACDTLASSSHRVGMIGYDL